MLPVLFWIGFLAGAVAPALPVQVSSGSVSSGSVSSGSVSSGSVSSGSVSSGSVALGSVPLGAVAEGTGGLELSWANPDLRWLFSGLVDSALEEGSRADLELLAERAFELGLDRQELRLAEALLSPQYESSGGMVDATRMGRLLFDAGRHADAIEALHKSVAEGLDQAELSRSEAKALVLARFDLAAAEERLGRTSAAVARQETLLRELAGLSEEHELRHLRARSNFGWIILKQGQAQRAYELYEELLGDFERAGASDHLYADRARTNLASCLLKLGRPEEARIVYGAVHEHWEQRLPADHNNLFAVRGNLAAAAHQTGQLRQAEEAYSKLLPEFDARYPGTLPAAIARANLGAIRIGLGDAGGAIAVLEEARPFLESLPVLHPIRVQFAHNMAAARLALGDGTGARELAQVTVEAVRNSTSVAPLDRLAAEALFARILRDSGEPERARALFQRIVDERSSLLPADHHDLVRSRRELFALAIGRGEFEPARSRLSEDLALLQRRGPPDHHDVIATCKLLAAVDLAEGRAGDAVARLRSAETVLAEHRPAASVSLIALRGRLLDALLTAGNLDECSPVVQDIGSGLLQRFSTAASFSRREARAVAERVGPLSERLAALPASVVDPAVLFRLLETRRVLGSGGTGIVSSTKLDGTASDLRGRLLRARQRVNELVYEGGVVADWNQRWVEVNFERDRLERELQDARGTELAVITPAAVGAALPTDAVAISYHRYRSGRVDAFFAWLVTPNGALERIELGGATEIATAIQAWRAVLGKGVPRGISSPENLSESQLGTALRRLVLDPVLARLSGPRATRLFISLDDCLHLLPFDGLPMEAENAPDARVGDLYRIHPQVSFQDLVVPVPFTMGSGMLIVSNPDFDAGPEEPLLADLRARPAGVSREGPKPVRALESWGLLGGTALEAQVITGLFELRFGSEPLELKGADATRAAVVSEFGSKRFVHLATHGWFEPEGVLSRAEEAFETGLGELDRSALERRVRGLAPWTLCGLCFAGANRGPRARALLTAEELAGCNLTGCELAVLSACETNVGIVRAGAGVLSLQAALRAAGARSALTSLWTVDDYITKDLMRRFYEELWVRKRTKAHALWRAKQAVRSEHPSPAHWAGWVLVGDPD